MCLKDLKRQESLSKTNMASWPVTIKPFYRRSGGHQMGVEYYLWRTRRQLLPGRCLKSISPTLKKTSSSGSLRSWVTPTVNLPAAPRRSLVNICAGVRHSGAVQTRSDRICGEERNPVFYTRMQAHTHTPARVLTKYIQTYTCIYVHNNLCMMMIFIPWGCSYEPVHP